MCVCVLVFSLGDFAHFENNFHYYRNKYLAHTCLYDDFHSFVMTMLNPTSFCFKSILFVHSTEQRYFRSTYTSFHRLINFNTNRIRIGNCVCTAARRSILWMLYFTCATTDTATTGRLIAKSLSIRWCRRQLRLPAIVNDIAATSIACNFNGR